MKSIINYVKYRLWAAQNYPDPELIHKYGGLGTIIGYLKTCPNPKVVKSILTQFGADIHPDAYIGNCITIHPNNMKSFKNLKIDAYGYVGNESILDLSDKIIIEKSAGVAMRTIILTHLNLGDFPDKPTAKFIRSKEKPTILRRGCTVGAGAIVLCGVEIGEDAIVNAGVVVDKNVPPRTIVNSSRMRDDYLIPDSIFQKLKT